ncbi:MAG TPA: L,D-transpeptidase family protein [Nevskiaceae bacterium]|nr:L,D-transpeptidase family protein [Nevskiaceae bacterium]
MAATAAPRPEPEQQLLRAIAEMQAGKGNAALHDLETLTQKEPNFRLAQLIYGELLTALSGARGGTVADDTTDPRVQELAEEARLRLESEKAIPPAGTAPSNVLKLAPAYKNIIVIDLPRARLYVMENGKDGQLTQQRHNYAAMGKNGYGKQAEGDNRTPLGVYHITGFKPPKLLPAFYGAGAFPLSYPNPWDVFRHRTGAGIWLHGVPPNLYNRPPRSSEGCVTMANDDVVALKPYVEFGQTPVVLSDDVKWLTQGELKADREAWEQRIETWRSKWAALDTDGYLSYYAPDFSVEGMNYAAFARYKHKVNAGKKFIHVKLSDLNLFRYPGAGEPLVLAEFKLDYRSDNFTQTRQKQQFWRQQKNGEWKIFREENR